MSASSYLLSSVVEIWIGAAWDRSGEYESSSFHRTTEMQSLWQASWLVANHSDLHFSDTLAILLLPFVHRRSLSPSGSTLLPSADCQ